MNETIINNFDTLKKEFERINKMGYVKGINNNRNASGLTFEHILNSTSGDICIPDYDNIELKVLRPYKLANINLFSSAPDGKHECGNQWLAENFGYKDINIKDPTYCNELLCTFSGTYTNKTKSGYKFSAKVDYIKCKIYLYIYDKNNRLISNNDIYWNFDTLEEKVLRKLKCLAIIDVKKRIIEKNNYYFYTKMKCYKLKSIATFFKLIENGTIKISINVGVYKTGEKRGKYNDHGTSFNILKKDISKLYEELYFI